jgi:hypothetical protein
VIFIDQLLKLYIPDCNNRDLYVNDLVKKPKKRAENGMFLYEQYNSKIDLIEAGIYCFTDLDGSNERATIKKHTEGIAYCITPEIHDEILSGANERKGMEKESITKYGKGYIKPRNMNKLAMYCANCGVTGDDGVIEWICPHHGADHLVVIKVKE